MGKKTKSTSKHEVIRDEKGQYIKGHSGNPGGRPKNTLTTILKERMMEDVVVNDKWLTTGDLIVDQAIQLALDGDMQAIKWIFERVDGRPIPMRLELVNEHKPFRILDIGFTETLEEIEDDEVIVIEKDGTERIEKKMEFDTLIVE
jgi:hypothetical protein|tara:strand:+ start:409 stop:846 length:438 start_codon:yes stop_codon:yes gene_type:complete